MQFKTICIYFLLFPYFILPMNEHVGPQLMMMYDIQQKDPQLDYHDIARCALVSKGWNDAVVKTAKLRIDFITKFVDKHTCIVNFRKDEVTWNRNGTACTFLGRDQDTSNYFNKYPALFRVQLTKRYNNWSMPRPVTYYDERVGISNKNLEKSVITMTTQDGSHTFDEIVYRSKNNSDTPENSFVYSIPRFNEHGEVRLYAHIVAGNKGTQIMEHSLDSKGQKKTRSCFLQWYGESTQKPFIIDESIMRLLIFAYAPIQETDTTKTFIIDFAAAKKIVDAIEKAMASVVQQ